MKNILCSARASTLCFVLASTFAIACSSTAPGEGTAFADESSATAADGGTDAGDTDAGDTDAGGTDDGKLCGPIIPNGRCAPGFVCQRDGVDTGHCTAEGRACGPDAVPHACPAGYTCAWKPGDIDVGHCTKNI